MDNKLKIKFGTDGFRAIIAKNFTFREIEIVAFAVSEYIYKMDMPAVINVCYDRRFMSDKFAKFMSDTFNALGVSTNYSQSAVPTPALSCAMRSGKAELGIMITASHNSYEYNGIKIKTHDGASAPQNIINEIQKTVDHYCECGIDYKKFREVHKIKNDGTNSQFDPIPKYLDNLKNAIDIDKIKKLKIRALVNPMFGVQAGLFEKFAKDNGLNISFEEMQSEHNPQFPGINPEPIAPNLKNMALKMKNAKADGTPYDIGLCYDGDGDRFAAMTSDGTFVSPQLIFSILLYHVAKNKQNKGNPANTPEIAKTFSVTSLVTKIAEKYNLKINQTPIGFKYIADLMLDKSKNVIIGGEESGGIGISYYMPERDGLFLSLILLEALCYEEKSIEQIIESLFNQFGRHDYDRDDYHLPEDKFNEVKNILSDNPPQKICGINVSEIQKLDGFKFMLSDGSWILFRFSGTEPVLRIYAESSQIQTVNNMLDFARDFLKLKC